MKLLQFEINNQLTGNTSLLLTISVDFTPTGVSATSSTGNLQGTFFLV